MICDQKKRGIMFTCQRRIFFKDVDSTGVIYFGALFHYALEAFELFLHHHKASLADFFLKGYAFPIVHAEADYTSPLRVSDEMSISLTVKSISSRSVSILTEMKNLNTDKIAGRVTLVHAFLLKGEEKASNIPEDVLKLLCKEDQ